LGTLSTTGVMRPTPRTSAAGSIMAEWLRHLSLDTFYIARTFSVKHSRVCVIDC
jgi:hypothetical protein